MKFIWMFAAMLTFVNMAISVTRFSPKGCNTVFERCLDQNDTISCTLKLYGCMRRYCEINASYSKTMLMVERKKWKCFVKHGLVILLD
ncbi:hypothetical protein ScPMuIL_002780 [Solemya velum]